MSAFIGRFPGDGVLGRNVFEVYVSSTGVELTPRHDETGTLTPIEARAMAHALIAASEEVERMRSKEPL